MRRSLWFVLELCLFAFGSCTNQRSELFASPCREKITQMCPQLKPSSSDWEILECLHLSDRSNSVIQLDDSCRKLAWEKASKLLQYHNTYNLLYDYCSVELGKTCRNKKTGSELLKCFVDSVSNLTNEDCSKFVRRIGFLTFIDPEAMNLYISDCSADLAKFHCGDLRDLKNTDDAFICLQRNLDSLQVACQKEVLHLSEIQAENISFDRKLYVMCSEERRRWCKSIRIGSGQVYDCLIQHKNEDGIAPQCLNELLRREKLIAQDYQVSRGLVRACREDIRKNHCRRSVSEVKDIRLAQILICLENATHNGNEVRPECGKEMLAHRRMLFNDYRLSPEIVTKCSADIKRLCSLDEISGKTIHCLMENAMVRKKNRISDQCYNELEILLKETDVGENWKADPVIAESCQSVANIACRDVDANKMTNCLLNKIGSEMMTTECERSLRAFQYFLARNFKLDPDLYLYCHDMAFRHCGVPKTWAISLRSPISRRQKFVLPCLYQIPNLAEEDPQCFKQIRRVMKQRALSVDLHPVIEQYCIKELWEYCSVNTRPREEVVCLQDNLEKLSANCSAAVYNFTELQSEFIELNPIITSNCKEVIAELCSPGQTTDHQDYLDCLIEKKNDPFMKTHSKCRVSVEHHQLISLKDYHFTYKFKKACKVHVSRFCPSAKEKSEVVRCLSEVIRNDTLLEHKQHVPKECHQQLRAQLLQQRENIDLNPKLKMECSADINKFCAKVPQGNARVLECLITNKKKLDERCRKKIFLVETQELTDSFTDYTLMNACKSMINKYCSNLSSSEQPLTCLKKYKYWEEFDFNCREVVVKRMMEQTGDYRFDPNLQKFCRKDISSLCSKLIAHRAEDKELEGKVIECLKVNFRAGKLTAQCEHQVVNILKEAALNYKLNPLLSRVCETEIQRYCDNGNDKIDKGEVEECLKQALYDHKITSNPCRDEIIELLNEAKADINADPMLYKACSKDLVTVCSHVGKGDGRQLDCLITYMSDPDPHKPKLHWQCEKMLRERVEMYKLRPEKRVENLSELYGTVSHSPSRKYFTVVALTFIGMIFISGMFCGRAMKRSAAWKNK